MGHGRPKDHVQKWLPGRVGGPIVALSAEGTSQTYPPAWSWPLPRMPWKGTLPCPLYSKTSEVCAHPCLPSFSLRSLLRALYSRFYRNTAPHPLSTNWLQEVTRDLCVAKSSGRFSVQTSCDPSVALTLLSSPSSLKLPSLVLQDPALSSLSSDLISCSFSVSCGRDLTVQTPTGAHQASSLFTSP